MPPKKKPNAKPLVGSALVKEVCRRIRLARSLWDAHRNAACRGEREKAIAEVQAAGGAEVYVEILAKPGQRVKKDASGD